MMVYELSFSAVSEVIDSWERIRRVKDYHKTFGILVFTKFLSMHPDSLHIFGLKREAMKRRRSASRAESQECVRSESFLEQTKKFADMFDSCIDMLCLDDEMFSDIMREMGAEHKSIGVKEEYYASMGIALMETLKFLDKKFNRETELCWRKVYLGVTLDLGRALQ